LQLSGFSAALSPFPLIRLFCRQQESHTLSSYNTFLTRVSDHAGCQDMVRHDRIPAFTPNMGLLQAIMHLGCFITSYQD